MKSFYNLLMSQFIVIGLVTLSVPKSAKALELGELKIGGNSCLAQTGEQKLGETKEGHFIIPMGMYLKKDEGNSLSRGSCNFSLAVKVDNSKRVLVKSSRILTSLRGKDEIKKLRVDLEVFKAGTIGTKQVAEAQSAASAKVRQESYLVHDDIYTSNCGESFILRGNLSGIIMGSGVGRIFTKNLIVDVVEEECQP